MGSSIQSDLIVLVADSNMRAAFAGILMMHQRFQIRSIKHDVRVLGNDPLAYRTSHEFLRDFHRMAAYALVVFDRHGCGTTKPREAIELDVEDLLRKNGWESRSAAIVIDPELENWLWSDSPHVAAALGWEAGKLKTWLTDNGCWPADAPKPSRPKEAVEGVLRHVRKPRSSDIYFQIAQQVSFQHCSDPPFVKLKRVLQGWFPQ